MTVTSARSYSRICGQISAEQETNRCGARCVSGVFSDQLMGGVGIAVEKADCDPLDSSAVSVAEHAIDLVVA